MKGLIFCAAHHACFVLKQLMIGLFKNILFLKFLFYFYLECNYFFVISVSLIVMLFTVSDINGELSRGRYGF